MARTPALKRGQRSFFQTMSNSRESASTMLSSLPSGSAIPVLSVFWVPWPAKVKRKTPPPSSSFLAALRIESTTLLNVAASPSSGSGRPVVGFCQADSKPALAAILNMDRASSSAHFRSSAVNTVDITRLIPTFSEIAWGIFFLPGTAEWFIFLNPGFGWNRFLEPTDPEYMTYTESLSNRDGPPQPAPAV